MKRWITCLAGVMMACSLAACTPTQVTETVPQKEANPEGITPEMVAESNASIKREADKTAPIYEMAFIYVPGSDSAKLVRERVDLEIVTEQALVDCLIEKGVLEEGTVVNAFDIEGGQKAGPGAGADVADGGERTGTLDLSKIPDAGADGETAMLTSIANTFIDNYELDKLKLLINGENYESGHTVQGDNDYLEYSDDYQES